MCPACPTKTNAELFYSSHTSLGIHADSLHSVDTDGHEYRINKFIVGIDTRNNLATVHQKSHTDDYESGVCIILLADQILELVDADSMV